MTDFIIILSGLVRSTAVNASRAKRAMMSHYQTYYEERAKTLNALHVLMRAQKYTVMQGVAPPTQLEREIGEEVRRLKDALEAL